MKLRVLNDNILIKQDPDEYLDKNQEVVRILKEGLITLPDAYEGGIKKISSKGSIVSWGSRCKYEHKEGERIMFKPFAGMKVSHGGEEYRVLSEWELIWKEE